MPPTIWTSKWRKPIVLRLASRHSANASMRSSSRSCPSLALSRSSAERARTPASSSDMSSGSSALIASATTRWRLISRSFGSSSLPRVSTTRLGYDWLDHGHSAVGALDRDLDHPRRLVEEHEESLAVGFQSRHGFGHRHGQDL